MTNTTPHDQIVKRLQTQMRTLFSQKKTVALHYSSGHSNTTRSKSYKKNSSRLHCGDLNEVLQIDCQKGVMSVEPRVTMEKLVNATLPFGMVVPVIPEFKGITVGGAIMGGAAESSSFQWGTFNDICLAYEFLTGDGTQLRVSAKEHPDIFYGMAGSYGSLGILTKAELKLVPAKQWVHLRTHLFSDPLDALAALQEMASRPQADFLDGIVFDEKRSVVIEGSMQSHPSSHPQFSVSSSWYYDHVKEVALRHPNNCYEECMLLSDYLFRYDQGAFWMGDYLFHPSLLFQLLGQGIFKLSSPHEEGFSEKEIRKFHSPRRRNLFLKALTSPYMNSQTLWGVLHKAEKWVQERFMIQDFCLPNEASCDFLKNVLKNPGVFPLWLCPIKGTRTPQLFSPHLLSEHSKQDAILNIGVYGLPSYSTSIKNLTKTLEHKTTLSRGRKVLYSHSYYTPEEFWKIYPQDAYNALRKKTQSEGIFPDILQKVLSA